MNKNHCKLNRINAKTEKTELLRIFFGISFAGHFEIHTGNVVEIGKRIKQSKEVLKSA